MRKPTVDYSEFRPSLINDPRFSHLKLLGWWIVYFALYLLTESLIPEERCTTVHSFLDDIIPFCEFFVIPYVAWYLLTAGSLLYFLLYNVENFKRLQIFIAVTQMVAMIIYILLPSKQELRPEVFPRDNVFSDVVGLLYSLDTNTGVCPSLHCAYSIGIASVWLKERSASKSFKAFVVIFCLTICLSTAFIKQHSILDFFAAIPLCILAEFISSKDYYRKTQT